MKLKLAIMAFIALIFVWGFVNFSISADVSRVLNITFDMDSKFEVSPGETLVINGSILNTGFLWLYDVNLTVENLPEGFTANIEPSHLDVFPRKFIFKDTPRGIPKPVNFTLEVTIPTNTTELVYEFNIKASGVFRQFIPSDLKYIIIGSVVRNQRIILKALPQAHFSVLDITVPDEVVENKPFNVSMVVINDGAISETVNLSLNAPLDWIVKEKTKSVDLHVDENSTVVFTVIPTTTNGSISVDVNYPYNQTIISFAKAGPFLMPTPLPTPEERPAPPTLFERITSGLKISNIIIAAVAIIGIIVMSWAVSRYMSKSKRSKPEEIKKE